jgi:putative Mg2+ transporter-C (MgtC) family protein
LQVSYEDGRGILRDILVTCTQHGFAISRVRVERDASSSNAHSTSTKESKGAVEDAPFADQPAHDESSDRGGPKVVTVSLEIQGAKSVAKLAAKLAEIAGVVSVNAGDGNISSD